MLLNNTAPAAGALGVFRSALDINGTTFRYNSAA